MNITPASHRPAPSLRPFTAVFDSVSPGEGLRRHVLLVKATDATDARRRSHEALVLAPGYQDWHDLGTTIHEGVNGDVLRCHHSPASIQPLMERFIYDGELLLQWVLRLS